MMHYTQKYLLDKIDRLHWEHTKLVMPLIKRIIVAEHAVKRVRELLDNLAIDEDGCVVPRDKEQLVALFNQALDGKQ